jgi:hypothetical protein
MIKAETVTAIMLVFRREAILYSYFGDYSKDRAIGIDF